MEDEYEVGEYYRTKNGEILKIVDLDEYGFLVDKFYYQIVKHSKNIIDLIECGDFVNGHKVKAIYLNGATKYIKLDNAYKDGQGTRTYKENIETILTKESYMANCYKVGGEDE